MAKAQKQQIVDEIFKLYDKAIAYHNNELKELYESKAITGGSYWYLLSPTREYCFTTFFGGDRKNGAPMFGFRKMQRTNVWHYQYILKEAQKFIAEIEKVIETGKHE